MEKGGQRVAREEDGKERFKEGSKSEKGNNESGKERGKGKDFNDVATC